MNIQTDPSLQQLTTMQCPAKANYLVTISSLAELQEAINKYSDQEKLVLGGGSNMVFISDYQGLVIKNQIMGIEVVNESEKEVVYKVGSGQVWHQFVEFAVSNNLGGIENLAWIPGTVGAAPIQNIGAYGVEFEEVCESVEFYNWETHELMMLKGSECDFGYRDSVFKNHLKGKGVVVAVHIRLQKPPHKLNLSYKGISEELDKRDVTEPTIQDVMKAVISVRKAKLPDPKTDPNSGSFFKNPVILMTQFEELMQSYPDIAHYVINDIEVKIPAAWLIENAGLKGIKSENKNVGTHPTQPLVIVNYGKAEGSEIVEFMQFIQKEVQAKFGIELENEVNLIFGI